MRSPFDAGIWWLVTAQGRNGDSDTRQERSNHPGLEHAWSFGWCHGVIGSIFSLKFSVCDGTKPTDLVSANTPHTRTVGTLWTELSRECTHTQHTQYLQGTNPNLYYSISSTKEAWESTRISQSKTIHSLCCWQPQQPRIIYRINCHDSYYQVTAPFPGLAATCSLT